MNDTPVHEQTLIQNLIAELTEVPVVTPDTPSRTLEIPRGCLLREWMELYWAALERPEFLDWASRFHIDLDTLQIKGDTLHAQIPSNGTTGARIFTLDDDSGWWQMAPVLLAISQRIDPAELGLPYIGGKSANPLFRFPRRVVLAFYGYPEPQNLAQAKVLVTELKKSGIAAIDEHGHTLSAIVAERNGQLQDFQVIATKIDELLQSSGPFEQQSLANTAVSLKSSSVSASQGGTSLKLGPLLTRYGRPIPENAADAESLAQELRRHTWPALPYVSDYVQTAAPIRRYREEFANLEDWRHMNRRLEALTWNRAPSAIIDFEEFSEPTSGSALAERMALGQRGLRTLGAHPDFKALLQKRNLSVDSPLLLTESGHVGTSSEQGWITLTSEVEKHIDLRVYRDRLKAKARKAGGAFRSNGQVTLGQMLRFYELPLPRSVEHCRALAQWIKSNSHLRPSLMDHWYLIGQPDVPAEGLSDQQRRSIIETTRAFLGEDTTPLIDYLSEGVDTDLPLATLKAKADYLIGRILITDRAQTLGNQLLKKLVPAEQPKELLGTNRDRLLLAALILNLEPSAGEDLNRIMGQRLEDSFFWGESYVEVRRFIDRQYDFALIKNKTLAAHLLLSGIAPEFLTRDIPSSLSYMSCQRWVRFKQVVLYIEKRLPGAARLMSFEQLSGLTIGPAPAAFVKFLRDDACAAVVVDWAIARGVIQRDAECPVTVYDAAALKQADVLFRNHNRLINGFYRQAFLMAFATPATVAQTDLRKVFADNPHLQKQAWFVSASSDDATSPRYRLAELHLAAKLSGDMQGWQSSSEQLPLASMRTSFARLGNVAKLFRAALGARLKQMRDAHIALINEAFCRLPLAQRLDIEDGRLQLLALQPVLASGNKQNAADAAPFGILVLVHGSTPRVFEIFTRRSDVVLRRDIDIASLKPSAAKEAAKSLPCDAEAYRNGTLPRANATCKAFISVLDIQGAPLEEQTRTAVPDTFSSTKVNAIARTAVRQLFDAFEAKALQDALTAPDLKDAEACHEKWLAFYQKLSPPKR